MKIGFRKPSIKRSVKARTTGRAKRAVKKAVIPTYGKKGTGIVKNPKKAVYNAAYSKTTVNTTGILKKLFRKSGAKKTSGFTPSAAPSPSQHNFKRSSGSGSSRSTPTNKRPNTKPLPAQKPYGLEHWFSIGEKSWMATRSITRLTIDNPEIKMEEIDSKTKRKPYVNVYQHGCLVFQVQARTGGYKMLVDRIDDPVSSITVVKKRSEYDPGHYYEITVRYKR